MKVYYKALNPCLTRKAKMDQYRNYFEKSGNELVNSPDDADKIVVWTCNVRSDWKDNSINTVKKFESDFNVEVVVAGCMPDIDPYSTKVNFTGEVVNWRDEDIKLDKIFGNNDIKLSDIDIKCCEPQLIDDIDVHRKFYPDTLYTHLDAYIKLFISEGCNEKCTYCAEIRAFPRYRSVPLKKLVKSCIDEVERSRCKKVAIIADSIGDYGYDTNSSLNELLDSLLSYDDNLVFHLNGLDPQYYIKDIDRFNKMISNGAIDHLNIPIQSASNYILKRMNRKYTNDDIELIFSTLRNYSFNSFSTHVIVGFPGETDEDYNQTIDFITRYKPKHVLLSGFLESSEIPASNLSDKINYDLINKRLINAHSKFTEAGIYCNTQNSDNSSRRIKAMNNS